MIGLPGQDRKYLVGISLKVSNPRELKSSVREGCPGHCTLPVGYINWSDRSSLELKVLVMT